MPKPKLYSDFLLFQRDIANLFEIVVWIIHGNQFVNHEKEMVMHECSMRRKPLLTITKWLLELWIFVYKYVKET